MPCAHLPPADVGQQLGAQADGEGREVRRQRLPQQLPHADQLGALLRGVQRRLRPAEHHEPVVPLEVGRQDVPGAEVALVELHPGVAQPGAEAGERIGLVHDDDEQAVHAVEVSSPRPDRASQGQHGPL